MKHSSPPEQSLRTVFRINAAFSGLNGLLMVAAPAQIASVLGITLPRSVFIVGISLIGFAIFLTWLVRRPRIHPAIAWGIVTADLAWVAFTALGLAAIPNTLTRLGTVLIIDVAVIVGGFALAQIFYLRKTIVAFRQ